MARITVEDCLDKLPNRFSLVLVASERAKQLLRGAASLVDNEDNKEVVTSLREIAAGNFDIDDSGVLAHDAFMPLERRAASPAEASPADEDEELPPVF
jgi:DNA-directed RNA polymerase subunit omega